MLNLSNFLLKFRNIDKNRDENIKLIASIFELKCNVKLNKDEILIDGSVLKLNTSPIKRNQIFMYKESIIQSLIEAKLKIVDIK